MAGATEKEIASLTKFRLLGDDCAGKLENENHSLVADWTMLMLRVLDPCGTAADSGLVDGLEFETLSSRTKEV